MTTAHPYDQPDTASSEKARETLSLLIGAAHLLGASAIESDATGCRFEFAQRSYRLNYCEGPVGAYVIGEMQLPTIRPEQDAKQILLGMYLNASLFRSAHFPIWYAVDPEQDALCLLFSLNVRDITSAGIAQIISGMATARLE